MKMLALNNITDISFNTADIKVLQNFKQVAADKIKELVRLNEEYEYLKKNEPLDSVILAEVLEERIDDIFEWHIDYLEPVQIDRLTRSLLYAGYTSSCTIHSIVQSGIDKALSDNKLCSKATVSLPDLYINLSEIYRKSGYGNEQIDAITKAAYHAEQFFFYRLLKAEKKVLRTSCNRALTVLDFSTHEDVPVLKKKLVNLRRRFS